jgi:hypothetical protein
MNRTVKIAAKRGVGPGAGFLCLLVEALGAALVSTLLSFSWLTAALAESLAPLRQEAQVVRLSELLRQAFASAGKNRPMLVAGRDGVMVQTRPCWEEASTATVSVYDRHGHVLNRYSGHVSDGYGVVHCQFK